MHARIHKSALLTIVHNAIDLYPRECFGWIYGELSRDHYVIRSAYAKANIHATPKHVTLRENNDDGLLPEMQRLSGSQFLGDYHTHPDEGDVSFSKPSGIDYTRMRGDLLGVYLIALIGKEQDYGRWSSDAQSLFGPVGEFDLKLTAWSYFSGRNRFLQVPLLSHALPSLNAALQQEQQPILRRRSSVVRGWKK